MSKARYQKMYTDKYNRDMDFVIVGDFYIGPFIDRASAEKSADNINGNALLYRKVPTRTKVEYVCIVDSLWNLQGYFEKGDLYMPVDSEDFRQITRDTEFAEHFLAESLYRRIETPITEREEFIKEACRLIRTSAQEDIDILGKMFDAGCRFVGE